MPSAPISAQGSNPRAAHVVAGTAADDEDLIVGVVWQDSVASDGLEIAVLDDNDLQIAAQLVWPIPGKPTQTTFDDFLHTVPESGFQFFITVRDSTGRDVLQPHAFRVVLECPRPTELCQWSTRDGLYTNALAISESLMTALDTLEARRSANLLADALDEPLDLRGPVFSLAAQVDRLDRQRDLGNGCLCAWYHVSFETPGEQQKRKSGPGRISGDSGSEQVEAEGKGAIASAAGQVLHFPMSHKATVTGTSRQTLKISCRRIHGWIEATDLPLPPSPGRPYRAIRFPIFESCPDSCLGTFNSMAIVDYSLAARVLDPMSGSKPVAWAEVDGFLARYDGANQAQIDPWDDTLEWVAGDTQAEQSKAIRIPTEGFFVDHNIREMTTTLSGRVTVELKAEEAKAWSYATAELTDTWLLTRGQAACAIHPTRVAQLFTLTVPRCWIPDLGASVDCGEPLIEPWF
ncbi:MAG: hypothetical protein AAF560_06825 [Acidobacteriota bacterium]